MSSSREQILARIRRGFKRGEVDDARRVELEQRLAQRPRNLIPARALLPHAEQVELFVQMAEEAAATVERVADKASVPAAVVTYLQRQALPNEVVMATDAELTELPWDRTGLEIQHRRAENGDKVTVTSAFTGIAETGTLMLLSGPDSPTTLNFLPDVHIVVLDAERIVGPYEDAWTLLRKQYPSLPRTVNFITGPSRSADIEQTLQLGAHGPIQLHVVLVEN